MVLVLPNSSTFSRKTQLAALVGSLGYVLVLLSTAGLAYGLTNLLAGLVSIQIGPWLWWSILGGAVVGALLAIAFAQYGSVTPLLSVVVIYGMAMYQMWQVLQAPEPLLPGTPLDLYLIGWPLLFLLALGSGLIERRVRTANASAKGSGNP
ncbi:hypothetical protein [Halorubrum sp. PV6]|uniref:hypothetical protein n=1 Tax=Halorubrum sp. PV6 TaxID=634157 RepID=UPI001445DDB6|nr:hypothetical protein [Halorubrum sp. PV6]